MANAINSALSEATVLRLEGNALVRHADGTQELLKAGAILKSGDVIVTEPGSVASIQFAGGGTLDIGKVGGDVLTIDQTVFDIYSDIKDVKIDDTDTVRELLAAVAAGGDLSDLLAATAAGGAEVGDSGHSFVMLQRISNTIEGASITGNAYQKALAASDVLPLVVPVVLDSVPPLAIAAGALTNSGLTTGNITNIESPSLAGSAEANSAGTSAGAAFTDGSVAITGIAIATNFSNAAVYSTNYFTTGEGVVVNGGIMTGGYTFLGEGSTLDGNISTGNFMRTDSGAVVTGSVLSGDDVAMGGSSTVSGSIAAAGGITAGAGSSQTILPTAIIVQEEIADALQRVTEAKNTLTAMGAGTELTTSMGNATLNAGVYSADALNSVDGTTLTLDGQGLLNQTWVFNITGSLVMAADTKVDLINAGEGASVLWNTGGYTSIGSGAQILGTIYSGEYLSVGEGTSITGPNGTNGGFFALSNYLSLGAGVHVGVASNASVASANLVTGIAVANSLVTLHSATETLGTVLADSNGDFSYTLTELNVAILGGEVIKTITASITDTTNQTITSTAFSYTDDLAGSFGNDTLLGTEGIDIIKSGIGDDILEGGGGADHLFGGDGIDTFVFNQGDSTAAFLDNGGTETTISGFDVIADFLAANGTVSGDLLSLPGTAVIAGSVTNADGVDSTSYADTVGSHTISNTGIVSFFSDDAGAVAVILDSANKLAVAVDYLTNNDLGNAGATLAFKTTIAGTADTYVYSQHDTNSGDTGTNNYSLVKLSGIDAAGVTTDALALTPDYIVID